mgnify:CR=1 FL=1
MQHWLAAMASGLIRRVRKGQEFRPGRADAGAGIGAGIGGGLLLAGLFGLVLFAAGASSQPQNAESRFLRIATGTTAGTYFPIGALIANAISKPPGARPCERGGSCGVPGLIAMAQTTSGSVQNLGQLRDGTAEAAMVQADLAFWAFSGQGYYAGKPAFTGLRAIANLYTETVHLVVRAESPIQSVADLKGLAVSLGEEGSGTLVETRLILEAYGLRESELQARFLRPGQAAERLASGEIAAFFLVGGPPITAISDLAQRLPVRLIPFDDLIAEQMRTRLRFLSSTAIPGSVYPGVPYTRSLGIGAQLLVRADLGDDLVYGMTSALWHDSTHRLLAEGHPRGRGITLANALRGLSVPLHPGAERYYQESGLLGTAAAARPEPAGPGVEVLDIKPPHLARFRPPQSPLPP